MDLSGEKGPGSMDPSADPSIRDCQAWDSDGMKCCADCRTTKTPLWRGGPSGPKTLCNACGIRYRKKRRAVMGLKERKVAGDSEAKRKSDDTELDRGSSRKMGSSLKVRMLGFGRRETFLKQGRFVQNPKQRMMGEEEQAAFLLMSLSSGFVYAN
ncbi:GATA transcription factor 16 [Apostasia shenzhenica]|uniref:GATA transcription factor 16 n=1 Tax=Apostasia shenzhenica TaxID=1088818 RepID=A0A2I0AB10_9ASPA|nr:GATA transcription factor 16 [Apostasia shenzhenica]